MCDVIAFIPEEPLFTEKSRAVLPEKLAYKESCSIILPAKGKSPFKIAAIITLAIELAATASL
jgi:homoserine kinase